MMYIEYPPPSMMYITYGGYPMYIREGVPDVHQGGVVPDVHFFPKTGTRE